MDWTNYQEPRCCAYTALLWPKQCPFSVMRVPSMSCPPIWINWPTPSIALCRLAGAVPAYLCSAKCGIQRGGFLSTRRTVVIAALPHGRGRQGPMALCSSIFGLGRPRPRLPKCQDSVHGRPGRGGRPFHGQCHVLSQSKVDPPSFLMAARPDILSAPSLASRQSCNFQAKSHPPLVSLIRLTQPTRIS
jgi:hypothetical protein